jgi:gliding motility-associated-like protein
MFIIAVMAISGRISAQVTIAANSTSGCSPLGVVIQVTAPSAGSISSYAWTVTRPDGSVHTASSNQYVAIFSQAGTYDVSLTVNGTQSVSMPDYITVFANPTASFAVNDPTGCFPHQAQFTSTSTPGSGAITSWAWDFGNGSTGTGSSVAHTYGQAGTYTPVLSIQDANGCFASVANPGMIQVLSTFPTVQFSASPATTCPVPATVNFNNTSSGNGSLTGTWTFGDAEGTTQSGTGTVSHDYAAPGTYQACLQVTDANGCQAQTCSNVNILSAANPMFTVNNTTVCTGSAVSFTNQTTPAANQYSWDFNGDGNPDSFSANPVYVFQTPGTYQPQLTATYSSTCSATVTGPTITVVPGLVVTFSANQTYGCEVPFTVTFTNNTSGTGISSNWFINGQNVGTGSPYTHTFTAHGNYNITLMSANSNGCSSQSTQNNMIVVQPPAVSFEHPNYLCTGETLEITGVSATSASPVVSWGWDFTGDMQIDATGTSPTWTFDTPGSYPVTAIATTQSGCTAVWTSPTPVTVLDAGIPSFTASSTLSCAGEAIEFCFAQLNGNEYSWNFGDASGWVAMDPAEMCIIHEYQDTGYFDISLTVYNEACNNTLTFEDYLYITPPVALFDFGVNCDDLFNVSFSDLSIEADQLIWDFGDGSAPVNNTTNLTHTFPGPGSYEVTLTAINDQLGCPDIATADIQLYPPSAAMTFEVTTDCPPALVEIHTVSNAVHWEVAISNGDTLIAHWSDDASRWQVSYTHGGTLEYAEYTSGQNFWPLLIFEYAGCYDIAVLARDAFGCEVTALYEDAVCADSGTDFADFSWSVIESCDRVEIAFTPLLDNLATWSWNFNETGSASSESPVYIFPEPYAYGEPLVVTLSATDAGGCASEVTREIPVDYPVIPAFTAGTPDACAQSTVSFTNTTPVTTAGFEWNFGDAASAENTATTFNASHFFALNGAYDVCLTATNASGCQRTACEPEAVQITTPEASFTFTSLFNSCLYAVTFQNTSTGNPVSVQWDFGDGQTGSGQTVYHTYPLGVYDVTLIVTNALGCSDTTVVEDLFNFGDVIGPFSAQLDEVVCAPFDVVLTAFNPADTYFSYFWDFNDGYGDPSGSTVSAHTYVTAGTYCPQLIMTDPNGCNVLIECTDPIVVEQFELNYTMDQEICAGEEISMVVTNGENYEWGPGTPVTPGADAGSFTLAPPASASYTLTGYFGDCVDHRLIDVIVHQLPEVSLSMPVSFCQAEEILPLTGGLPSGAGGYYAINGIQSTGLDLSSSPGAYTVQYFFTDTTGCSAQASADIAIHALPEVTLPQNIAFCDNSGIIPLSQGTPAGGQYFLGGSAAAEFNTADGAGIYPLSYHFTDANGCFSSDSTNMVVHPSPLSDVSITSVCQGEELEVVNGSSISSGIIASTSWQIAGQQYTAHTPADIAMPLPGEFTYTVVMESDQGCSTQAAGTFAVWAAPLASFSYEIACENQPTVFTALGNVTTGLVASYEWTADGTPVGTASTASYAYSDYESAFMTLVVTNAEGCSSATTQPVTVRPAPDLTIQHGPACAGSEVVFAGNAAIPFGGIAGYTWNFGNGVPAETGSMADHLYDAPGEFMVQLTAVSNLGCETVLDQIITIYPVPQAAFVLDQESICGNGTVGMLDLSSVDSPSDVTGYSWFLDNEWVSGEASPQVAAPGPGTYDVRLEVVTDAGCKGESTQAGALQVYPAPKAGFDLLREELTMANPRVVIENTASQDVTAWSYDFGDGQSASFAEGMHDYATWDLYTITQVVTNAFGCSDTTSRNVLVSEEAILYIPNAFTPDGNGHNEVFRPVVSGFTPTFYSFSIFNRWGRLVFETNDLEGSWNGQMLNTGEMSQDGAYTWKLEYQTEQDPTIRRMDGMVILLK